MSRPPIAAEPHWRPALRLSAAQLPWGVRRWLLDAGSTSRLIRMAGGAPPDIRLRRQLWAAPQPGERRFLSSPPRRLSMIREVEIYCGKEPWMLARTIAPQTLPRHVLQAVRLLNDNPIAGLLHQTPGAKRSSFDVARLYGEHPPLSPTLHWDAPVWGRRSLFFFHGTALLLSECFLPGFQRWLEQTANE